MVEGSLEPVGSSSSEQMPSFLKPVHLRCIHKRKMLGLIFEKYTPVASRMTLHKSYHSRIYVEKVLF